MKLNIYYISNFFASIQYIKRHVLYSKSQLPDFVVAKCKYYRPTLYLKLVRPTLSATLSFLHTVYTSYIYSWKWQVAKYGNPYSELVLCIYPIQSAHTHSSEHTHTPWTHTRSSGAQGAVGGSVPCSREPQSWYVEGGESAGYLLPPPTIPAWPETRAARLIVKRSRSRFKYPHDLISEWQQFARVY